MDETTRSFWKRLILTSLSFIALVGLISGGIIYGLRSQGYSLVVVFGSSMEPTYHNNQFLLFQSQDQLKDQQLIVFQKPEEWNTSLSSEKKLFKRAVAIPGDTIELSPTGFSVNGKLLVSFEDYTCKLTNYSYTLKPGEVFALGDNHRSSYDSLWVLCKDQGDYLIAEDKLLLKGEVKWAIE